MRVAPDTKQVSSISSSKKGRKRTFSGQDQIEESDSKLELKSWILETADQVTVGEVYTICGGSDGRLQLTYSWERRSKTGCDLDHTGIFSAIYTFSSVHFFKFYVSVSPGRDVVSLLHALVNVAKSSLTKSLPSGEGFTAKKAVRRQIVSSQPSDGSSSEIGGASTGVNSMRSPLSEASPSHNTSTESPIQVLNEFF